MTDLSIGRVCRTLRRRLRWRQTDLAARAGVSQSLISDIERGQLRHVGLATLRRVFESLEVDLVLNARWRGGELDRLLDEDHSRLVAAIAGWLRRNGWEVQVEVTYSEYGERGSIDVLAWHGPTRTLLVIEVKSTIASAEETLRRLDAKVRLAPTIGTRRFGVAPAAVAMLLVVGDTSTNRRRVARLRAMGAFGNLSAREVRAWLRAPSSPITGVLFLQPPTAAAGGTRRVRVPRRGPAV